jgi:hypothetical protein
MIGRLVIVNLKLGPPFFFFRSEKKIVRMTRGVRENAGSFFIFGAALPSSLQDSAWSPVGFQHDSSNEFLMSHCRVDHSGAQMDGVIGIDFNLCQALGDV